MAANTNRQFGMIDRKKAKSTEKLASGYKINRAADDAACLSISEKMRSQIRRLNQAADNVEDGISLVQTADGALNEVHNLLGRQRELLVKAANEVNADEDLQSIEDELSQLEQEFDHIFESTQFNGKYLFQGQDTIIAGPNLTETNNTTTPVTTSTTKTSSKIIWIDKNTPPSDQHIVDAINDKTTLKATYEETETEAGLDRNGNTLFDENSIYTEYTYVDTDQKITDITYEKQTANTIYTDMINPGDMVGNNGYINVKNVARDLDLSCAMSQLGVKVDGKLITYDLYNSKFPKNTVISADKKTATTTYSLGDDVNLSQKISLTTDGNGLQQYNISYSVTDNSQSSHTVEVRLAFDTMNTRTTAQKNKNDYTLESDFAAISISHTGTNESAMGDISDLYDTWDASKINEGNIVSKHTGAGFWWSGTTNGSSSSNELQLGSVTYGPITLKKEPYKVTTTTENVHTKNTKYYQRKETATILPEYLDIQSGGNESEYMSIRLYNLSTDNLKIKVGRAQPISAFHATDSLDHIDRTTKKISGIRSYYGAVQNRLDTTYNNILNYSENLQSSESHIRDTDMATEITENAKLSILQQAAQSMLAQANSSNQGILNLLK